MAQLAHSNARILSDEAFGSILESLKDRLCEKHDAERFILNIVLAPEGNHFHVSIDARQNQVELLDEALARAREDDDAETPDSSDQEFAREIKRVWSKYDYEELILCLITVGRATQLTTYPKPWFEGTKHQHCPCGIRKGADAEHDADHIEGEIVGRAAHLLEELLDEHKVPPSHGVEHAHRVMAHTAGALEAHGETVDRRTRVTLILAALLHDADDRKYFGADSRNAEAILAQVLADLDPASTFTEADAEEMKATALEAISYVSTSKNGNVIPEAARQNPLLLYPRYADRLEAIGEVGVVRCWQYTEEVGRPLYTDETPKPTSAAEVLALATEDRFRGYQARGESPSMVDHFFDKLVHLVQPLVHHSNRYFSTLGAMRLEPLVEVCTADRPDALKARLELAKARTETGAV